MAKVVKPPRKVNFYDEATVFLAGSIEMGKVEDWRSEVEKALKDFDVTILNPRRDDWDSSWEQSIENPQFVEQVTWELEGLERADLIAMCFQPGTKSPITLLELGLSVNRQSPIIVLCPEEYWKKGNVDIVCDRYGAIQAAGFDEFKAMIVSELSLK